VNFSDRIPDDAPIAVVLIEQEGCGACEEFHPVFVGIAEPYATEGLPILRLEANTPDPTAQAFLAKHAVRATPTVLLVPRWAYAVKLEGPQPPLALRQALDWANNMHRVGTGQAPRWWQT